MPDEEAPLLSASQIESYLECPYKWFSLRRLRLHDADALFSGAETGTFAHRVLEVTHRNLLARAVQRAAGFDALSRIEDSEPEGMQAKAYAEEAERLVLAAQADPAARVPGSRVLAGASSTRPATCSGASSTPTWHTSTSSSAARSPCRRRSSRTRRPTSGTSTAFAATC